MKENKGNDDSWQHDMTISKITNNDREMKMTIKQLTQSVNMSNHRTPKSFQEL